VRFLGLVAFMFWTAHVLGQATITTDGTVGTVVSSMDNLAHTITGGTQKQGNGAINLFHSFDRFSVPATSVGGSATFVGNPSTTNVISRVTGHLTGRELSRIDGVVDTKTSMPAANFFLINPAGIVFGPEARLDVGGAFRASTADYIKLEDGLVFSAVPVDGETRALTAAAPHAFGFLTENPARISPYQRRGGV
jgi:filamentous hemagglutinin family protein